VATTLAAVTAAGLFGWAIALALGFWGNTQMAKLPPWTPFALQQPSLGGAVVASPVALGTARLVGVAGSRAYFMTGSAGAVRSLSLGAGDALPSGEKIVRVERDGIVVASGGQESRVPVFGARAEPAKKALLAAAGSVAAPNCRLTGADRSAAIFIEANMVKALTAERATFARMFEPQAGSGGAGGAGGIRAKGTGGITAMFAILDGDVLLRADGVSIKSSDAIISDVLARVARGNSVVVEGERNGAPRRWVYAPAGCAQPADAKSSSKSSG
jgi:hypothetical protein